MAALRTLLLIGGATVVVVGLIMHSVETDSTPPGVPVVICADSTNGLLFKEEDAVRGVIKKTIPVHPSCWTGWIRLVPGWPSRVDTPGKTGADYFFQGSSVAFHLQQFESAKSVPSSVFRLHVPPDGDGVATIYQTRPD